MGRIVKGQGYVSDPGDAPTGRYAKPRLEELGKGRASPVNREMPYARHMGIEIFVGMSPPGDGSGTTGADTVAAKDEAIALFDAWKEETENEHFTILEIRFEFIAEGKMALYAIYSE